MQKVPKHFTKKVKVYTIACMAKTQVSFKIDEDLKKDAQSLASEMGLNLNAVVNATLRNFVTSKVLHIDLNSYEPSPYLQRVIAQAEEEIARGETLGPFNTVEEMFESLNSDE